MKSIYPSPIKTPLIVILSASYIGTTYAVEAGKITVDGRPEPSATTVYVKNTLNSPIKAGAPIRNKDIKFVAGQEFQEIPKHYSSPTGNSSFAAKFPDYKDIGYDFYKNNGFITFTPDSNHYCKTTPNPYSNSSCNWDPAVNQIGGEYPYSFKCGQRDVHFSIILNQNVVFEKWYSAAYKALLPVFGIISVGGVFTFSAVTFSTIIGAIADPSISAWTYLKGTLKEYPAWKTGMLTTANGAMLGGMLGSALLSYEMVNGVILNARVVDMKLASPAKNQEVLLDNPASNIIRVDGCLIALNRLPDDLEPEKKGAAVVLDIRQILPSGSYLDAIESAVYDTNTGDLTGKAKALNGSKKDTRLYTHKCVKESDIYIKDGHLGCTEIAPPGDYRNYFKFSEEVSNNEANYDYDEVSGILRARGSGDGIHNPYFELNYKQDCKDGSWVNYDPYSKKLYCLPKINISGDYIHYCKGGYSIDKNDNLTVKDCQRDGLPKSDVTINLKKCPDPYYRVINLAVEEDKSTYAFWGSGITNPGVAKKQKHYQYVLKCVDLNAPTFRDPNAKIPANPFNRAFNDNNKASSTTPASGAAKTNSINNAYTPPKIPTNF
jgi:hypothetical protein